jgi:16S rRNA (guanine966-N2)-methyltransferase
MFSTVEALRGGLDGASCLDLFAGAGAVGLEALSRGAARVAFVESGRAALVALRANLARTGLDGALVLAGRAQAVLARPAPFAAELVFADPPYAMAHPELAGLLVGARSRGWIADGALLAVERAARTGRFAWPAGFTPLRHRRYGEAIVWYGHAAAGDG